MSKPKRAPGNVAPPKGQAMAPEVPEVLPPDGWVKRSPLGFLGYAGGDLARLGDVLVWMERTKGLPRAVSVRELVRDMPEDVMASLYYISRADEFGGERYADLMPPDSTFSGLGSLPSPAWRSEQEHQTALEAVRLARNPNAKTGRAALAECLKRWATAPVMEQTDPVNNPASHASRLAVPMHLAFRWWDYGQLAEQQAAPTGETADAWDGARLWGRMGELKADGKGKHTQRLVQESGVPERKIRRLVEPYRPADTKKAGAIGAMARTVVKDGTKTRR